MAEKIIAVAGRVAANADCTTTAEVAHSIFTPAKGSIERTKAGFAGNATVTV